MTKSTSYRLPVSARLDLDYLVEREERSVAKVISLAVRQWLRAGRPRVETQGPGGAPLPVHLAQETADLIERIRGDGTRTEVVAQAVSYRAQRAREEPASLVPGRVAV